MLQAKGTNAITLTLIYCKCMYFTYNIIVESNNYVKAINSTSAGRPLSILYRPIYTLMWHNEYPHPLTLIELSTGIHT